MANAATPGYRVLAPEDVEAIPGPASLAWRPLRAELGLRAFGLSSFFAADAGEDVIEPHDETTGRGHQELYVVVRGTARFTLNGEDFEAPVGTLVGVPDPTVHRHAVAVQPGTEVLAFGGDPVFQPAGHEWMWRVRHLLPDRVERARALADDALSQMPDSPGIMYVQALVAAAEEDTERAETWLQRAVERDAGLLQEARSEELLSGLTDELGS